MMALAADLFKGNGLMARVLRSTSWLIIGYGGGQALRLASNLILTRLLFPEAFGLMALVTVITVGLSLFSDVGIGPSIAQSKRGDAPAFLDTAWTLQVIRGCLLWGMTFVLAWPVAELYNAPELVYFLPIAGTALALSGLNPTRIETAHRHLLLGRVTALELISQVIGLSVMVLLALATHSVMALVVGGVIQTATKLVMCHYLLPGQKNRLHWDRSAAGELIHFGKWIFLSTAFWFITSQGDRAILGKFVPLETLGIYSVAYFVGSFPRSLGYTINQRLMIPVYRDKPAHADPRNHRKIQLLRYGLSIGLLLALWTLMLIGPWLVDTLYDDRYTLAGAILVPLALAMTPSVVVMTYDQAALAAGDSRLFFILNATRAFLQTSMFLVGVIWFGLPGGVAAMGLSMLATYPVVIYLAKKHRVWDPVHDAVFFTATALIGLFALWYHWGVVGGLFTALHP